METSLQTEGPISGQMDIAFLGKSEESINVIGIGEPFTMRSILQIEEAPEDIKPIKLIAKFYLESLRSESGFDFQPVEKPWEVDKQLFVFDLFVPAYILREGVYKSACVVTLECEDSPPIHMYADGPMLQIYS